MNLILSLAGKSRKSDIKISSSRILLKPSDVLRFDENRKIELYIYFIHKFQSINQDAYCLQTVLLNIVVEICVVEKTNLFCGKSSNDKCCDSVI